ncbi:hypothetical protein BUALT_Bualt09G0048400 [Buddleja alternifolia]|uniref:Major facilitator superfamily (MFS) profile domain-containing protein n=1 Tax=Buddleja alternifolia TaxID=168488 RepID=A0AAV6X4G8_9LAMI|nr:hypothetical protein BUALT_Bualt09G0048400 [Buddleja alternifolia]
MGDDDYDEERRRQGYTVDEALSTMGFGNFQGFALCFGGTGWFADAMEISLLSFIGPALKSEWLISPNEESFLSSAIFGGMFIGACESSEMKLILTQWRMGIQCVTMITSGAGLLSAFSPDYKSLVILRFFVGFGAVGGHVFHSWFLEFIPRSNRGAWMLVISGFWVIGELLEASLAWAHCHPKIRYLFMKGRTNEAIRVLEKVAIINRKELPTGNLVSDQQRIRIDEENVTSEETHLLSSNEKNTTSIQTCLKSLLGLFSPDLLTTTLLLLLLSFAYTFAYYGLQLMISALSSGQSDCHTLNSIFSENVPKDSLYIDVFITYIAELPGLVLAAILVDRLGRKLSIEILTMMAVILILPMLSHQSGTVTIALLVGARTFHSAAFSTLAIYAKEVYPTSIRGSGSGLVTAFGKIGGVICPLVAVGLVRGCHQTLAVIMFGIIILISGIGVIFFRFEMKGRALSDFTSDTK